MVQPRRLGILAGAVVAGGVLLASVASAAAVSFTMTPNPAAVGAPVTLAAGVTCVGALPTTSPQIGAPGQVAINVGDVTVTTVQAGPGGVWSATVNAPTAPTTVNVVANCLPNNGAWTEALVVTDTTTTSTTMSTTPTTVTTSTTPSTVTTSTGTTTGTTTTPSSPPSSTKPPASPTPTASSTASQGISLIGYAGSVHSGGTVHISAHGFKPGEKVTVTLHSVPIVLTTFIADAAGQVNGVVTIPPDETLGQHTIILDGSDSGVSLSAEITITADESSSTPSSTAAPTSVVTESSQSGGLANTGATAAGPLSLAGIGLLIAGAALIVGFRRRGRTQGEGSHR